MSGSDSDSVSDYSLNGAISADTAGRNFQKDVHVNSRLGQTQFSGRDQHEIMVASVFRIERDELRHRHTAL